MTYKEKIIKLLSEGSMTQSELAKNIVGDKHASSIYPAISKLMELGIIERTKESPFYYSLSNNKNLSSNKIKEIKSNENHIDLKITNEIIEEVHLQVINSDSYGKENELITDCFKRFPNNEDITIVAMKIGLIDITNSTHVSQHKSLISAVELAESIVNIKNIDERIAKGDPEVVNEIARSNGKINLFSFATKYCCYHNVNLYNRDDYSILDTVVKESLPLYFDDISKSQIQKWQDNFEYKKYNDFINKKLDELGINIDFRKRKFDHYIWYKNK